MRRCLAEDHGSERNEAADKTDTQSDESNDYEHEKQRIAGDGFGIAAYPFDRTGHHCGDITEDSRHSNGSSLKNSSLHI